MTYLVPFNLAMPPDEQVNFRAMILRDESDIPDDSYQFQEWYCPNPGCDCFQGLLEVVAIQQKSIAAQVYVPFDPSLTPFLAPKSTITPTALALLEVISQHLREDPAYLKRLRDHYWLVRSVAIDKKHPRHTALIEYGSKGANRPGRKKRSARTLP